jgi:hypothetical protein
MKDSGLKQQEPSSPAFEKLMTNLKKNAKDTKTADTLEHMVRDAYNGDNEELADIFRRMIEAEMKHPKRRLPGCELCEAEQISDSRTQE